MNDCRKNKNRNSFKCNSKKIHKKFCNIKNSKIGNATKTFASSISPQAAIVVAAVDITQATICKK